MNLLQSVAPAAAALACAASHASLSVIVTLSASHPLGLGQRARVMAKIANRAWKYQP